jgi:hypothetical protein
VGIDTPRLHRYDSCARRRDNLKILRSALLRVRDLARGGNNPIRVSVEPVMPCACTLIAYAVGMANFSFAAGSPPALPRFITMANTGIPLAGIPHGPSIGPLVVRFQPQRMVRGTCDARSATFGSTSYSPLRIPLARFTWRASTPPFNWITTSTLRLVALAAVLGKRDQFSAVARTVSSRSSLWSMES